MRLSTKETRSISKGCEEKGGTADGGGGGEVNRGGFGLLQLDPRIALDNIRTLYPFMNMGQCLKPVPKRSRQRLHELEAYKIGRKASRPHLWCLAQFTGVPPACPTQRVSGVVVCRLGWHGGSLCIPFSYHFEKSWNEICRSVKGLVLVNAISELHITLLPSFPSAGIRFISTILAHPSVALVACPVRDVSSVTRPLMCGKSRFR